MIKKKSHCLFNAVFGSPVLSIGTHSYLSLAKLLHPCSKKNKNKKFQVYPIEIDIERLPIPMI